MLAHTTADTDTRSGIREAIHSRMQVSRARKPTANIGLVSPNCEMVCSSRGLTLHLSVGVDVVEKQQPPIPASREVPSVFAYKVSESCAHL
jgi:hypothetical protein